MSKVTIKKVFQAEKETKFGMKVSVGLKIEEETVTDVNGETVEVKDRYINGWFPKGYEFPFQEGDIVNILIAERDVYLDFKIPDGSTSGDMSITSRVLKLEKQMKGLLGETKDTSDKEPEGEEEADPSEDF